MNIILAKKEDALEIAEIHKTEIHKGFLSALSVPFLKNLYLALIESDKSFCIVARENSRVIGFISGVEDLDKFYFSFFKKYFFQSVILLFKKFFSISFLVKIFETSFYPIKEKELPKAELLTMAVKNEFHSQGIASKMFLKFVSEMRNQNVKSFKVLVGEGLKPAISFYEKNGFKFLKNTKIHGNKTSKIYIYDI